MSKKEIKVREITPQDLKFDENNYNSGSEFGMAMLEKSIESNGIGRGIVASNDGTIIGGNKTFEKVTQMFDEGTLKIIEVETTGNTLVVTKRTDIEDSKDAKFKELALYDNRTSEVNLKWNDEALLRDFSESELMEKWHLNLNELNEIENTEKTDEKNNYSRKIEVPTYEPKNEKPPVNELFDIEKTNKLIEEIENSSCDKEIKTFLTFAAQRHIVFNYSKIADFYAHANKETQNLMENSALVIIDFNKALELGYVKLSKEISTLYGSDYDE